jgi:Family of unknown function (DUF6498)
MKRKKVLTDPGFWVLIGINVYLIIHYYNNPAIFTTLIWLYWSQSVMMGLFNAVDILTVRTVQTEPDKATGQPVSSMFKNRVRGALFFTVHYGFFHLAYLIFIATMKRSGPFQWDFYKYFIMAFFVGQVINFVQHKIQQRRAASNIGTMFFVPYLRIIPMHLTILIPAFLNISNLGIFLILKSVADVVMYIVTKPAPNTRESNEAMLAAQQTMNI